jgi:ankyrin repeat protein
VTRHPRSGNTALHMCVFHDQLDMYDHLVEYCGAHEHVRNNRGQTPLVLAASLGKVRGWWCGVQGWV